MIIEKRVIQTEDIYIANDGKKFDTEIECLAYEKYYPKTIYEVVKDYIVTNEETLEAFKRNEIPTQAYVIVLKHIPNDIRAYAKTIEVGRCNKSGLPYNYKEYDYPCLFYNDWSAAYNGFSNASVGWKRMGTESDFKEAMQNFKTYKKLMRG